MADFTSYLPPLLTGANLLEALTHFPKYTAEVRLLSASERLMRLTDIYRIFAPTMMSTDIYHKLYTMTYMSLTQKGTINSVRQLNAVSRWMSNNEYNGVITGATSGSLIGPSGVGKSTCLQRAVKLLGGVIEPHGTCHKIIPVLLINCPFDSNYKGLLSQIIVAVDEALGSTYYDSVGGNRANSQQLLGLVAQICHLHIGTLIVDEIQFVIEHRAGKQLYMMLVQLINMSGISILLVGTPDCTDFLLQAPQMARRSVGLQYGPMQYNEDFRKLCSVLYSYQYVSNASVFNESIGCWLYSHSGGVPASVIALFHDAQEIAITRNIETIGIETLTTAYNERMKMLHRHISPNLQPMLRQTTKLKREHLPTPKEVSLHVAVTRTMADVVADYKCTRSDLINGLRSLFSVEEIDVSVHAEDLPR